MIGIFRNIMIEYWRRLPFFYINFFSQNSLHKKITSVNNLEYYLKRKQKEANIFYVLPLASAWSRTVDVGVSFLIETWIEAVVSYLRFASDPSSYERSH